MSQHTVAGAIASVLPTLTRTIEDRDFTVDVSTLPDASIRYLLQYGFSQAIADTQALGKDGKLAAAKKAKIITDDTTAEPTEGPYVEWLATYLRDRASLRLAALAEGKMEFASGVRLSPEDRDRRDITEEMLKAAAKQHNLKLPTEAAERKPLLDHVYASAKDHIEKEVARRAKARAATSSIDLSTFRT